MAADLSTGEAGLIMDLTTLQKQLADLSAALPLIQEQVKERAVQEAIAGGAVVRIVPEYFQRPVRAKKGEPAHVDPWFSLNQWEWQAEIEAGFAGWYEVNEGGGRKKTMINYEAARAWFAAKMSGQQQRRSAAA